MPMHAETLDLAILYIVKLTITIFLLKVIFSGPANVSATVFDHGNGSYEAIALLVDPGYYTVIATIERSLCEGYREPKPSFYPSCKCDGN